MDKKITLLRQNFRKVAKKSEFYRGEIGGKCDLIAKSGLHADCIFWGFLIFFRAKSPHFCTFYRLVNLLEISQICLKIFGVDKNSHLASKLITIHKKLNIHMPLWRNRQTQWT